MGPYGIFPLQKRVWIGMSLDTYIHTHARGHTHTEWGLEGVPVKPFCGNDLFARKKKNVKKSMKANGDPASNSRAGYPG